MKQKSWFVKINKINKLLVRLMSKNISESTLSIMGVVTPRLYANIFNILNGMHKFLEKYYKSSPKKKQIILTTLSILKELNL